LFSLLASKAIDCLLDSKWASRDKDQKEALFTNRESVVAFMKKMLAHKLFHRAKKIIVTKEKKKKQDQDESTAGEDGKEKKKEKIKKDNTKTEKVEETKKKEKVKEEKSEKKEKKKVKLNMHFEQIFIDCNEVGCFKKTFAKLNYATV